MEALTPFLLAYEEATVKILPGSLKNNNNKKRELIGAVFFRRKRKECSAHREKPASVHNVRST